MKAEISVDKAAFDEVVGRMTNEAATRIAVLFPEHFAAVMRYTPLDEDREPEEPAERRAAAPVNIEAVKARCLAHLGGCAFGKPGPRAEDVARSLNMDGALVKRALTALVKDNKAYVDGVRRGARYTPKLSAAPAGSAPAEGE